MNHPAATQEETACAQSERAAIMCGAMLNDIIARFCNVYNLRHTFLLLRCCSYTQTAHSPPRCFQLQCTETWPPAQQKEHCFSIICRYVGRIRIDSNKHLKLPAPRCASYYETDRLMCPSALAGSHALLFVWANVLSDELSAILTLAALLFQL